MVPTSALPRSPGHPFYVALNKLLTEAKFDEYVEGLCAPLYKDGGRPSIPPGVFFRMLFIGYFEGIDSQRGIAWRCSDSLSLRSFLGLPATAASPDHSSLTVIRKRLPKELIEQVFVFVLKIAVEKKLLKGSTIGVDSTTLEANAAMKSIVRKDDGDGWKEYVTKLAKAEGIDNPTDAELRNFDRKRKGRKTSNDDWQSPSDPDARITKMKDGTTHLAYKAEHAVDLDSEIVIAANVQPADVSDAESIKNTIVESQGNLLEATGDAKVAEVAADKGYHKNETLAWCAERGVSTYIPERENGRRRRWTDKPSAWRAAVYNNRRRTRRAKGKAMQRRRSEVVERSFAHTCETGGGRRSWIRGLVEVGKRYLVNVIAHNLGVVLRKLFGVGKPKEWAAFSAQLLAVLSRLLGLRHLLVIYRLVRDTGRSLAASESRPPRIAFAAPSAP
jgi:transposase